MLGGIGGYFIKRLNKDLFSGRFLPGSKHGIVDVVIYGSRGGVVDHWHSRSGELGERIVGGSVCVKEAHGGILLDPGTDGGLGGEWSGIKDVTFRAGDSDGATRLGGVRVI